MTGTVTLVFGLLLLAGAGLRRRQLLARRRAQIGAGLRSSDPAQRGFAIREIAAVGVRAFTPMLLQRVAELDPGDPALGEILKLVARCQWEPADTPGVVQLRLWASSVDVPRADIVPAAPPVRLVDLRDRVADALQVPRGQVRFIPFPSAVHSPEHVHTG